MDGEGFYFGALWEEVAKAKGPSDEEIAAAIEKAADSWGTKIAQAFAEAVEKLRDKVDLTEVTRLIGTGQLQQALDTITDLTARQGFAELAAVLIRAAQAGARLAAEFAKPYGGLPAVAGLEILFDETNPATVAFLRRYSFDLITELSTEVRGQVAQALRVGNSTGVNPKQVAVAVKDAIGLTTRQNAAVARYAAELKNGEAMAALARDLRDKRFDRTVLRAAGYAIKDGKKVKVAAKPLTADQQAKMVDAYRRKFIKHRAVTIARTEATRAMNVGIQRLWLQQIEQGLVTMDQLRKKWVYTADDKVRHAHETIPRRNKAGVRFDQPFDSELGPIMFPGDPDAVAANTVNCRCTHIVRIIPVF